MGEIARVERKLKNGVTEVLRTGEDDDAGELNDCVSRYIHQNDGMVYEPGEFRKTLEDGRKWSRDMRQNPSEVLILAEVDGRIVGNIDFHVGKRVRTAHAGEFGMGLLPEWRGLGLGTLLLRELIAWARGVQGLEKINLRTNASNSRAIALYRKLGFVEEGRLARDLKYRDGTYAETVLMALFLR